MAAIKLGTEAICPRGQYGSVDIMTAVGNSGFHTDEFIYYRSDPESVKVRYLADNKNFFL